MKILTPNTIKDLDKLFSSDFRIETYKDLTELKSKITSTDILLVRSNIRVNSELLANTNLKGIATLSSGSCHIDKKYLIEKNIKIFDGKGANAPAVRDYILSVIAYLQKKQLIYNNPDNKIGIIGYGYVGKIVSTSLKELGFNVVIYDPFVLPNNSIEDVYSTKVVLIHANLHDGPAFASRNLINREFFDQLSSDSIIINVARGGIVDETALLKNDKNLIYCTDVYNNEPNINPLIIKRSLLCTTHIAGHSIECKENISKLVSQKIHHEFGLKPPSCTFFTEKTLILDKSNWQQRVLSLYNPEIESLALKIAQDKTATFLNLRKLHKRHNFTY